MTSAHGPQSWSAHTLFSYGFRPFFLFGALWAALAMALWIAMLAGIIALPTRMEPLSWHAHEFLFGYISAIIAGFLLTAVPNWTGRLPIKGSRLIALFALWIAGRIAVACSALLPIGLAGMIDLTFPIVLTLMILREIVAAQKWGNLVVLALLAVFTFANLLFHLETARGEVASQGVGLRLGLATVLLMISLIGGRIIPSFTRNWLTKAGQTQLPPAPMQRFDKITLLATVIALVLWVLHPSIPQTGAALIGLGVLHLIRLARWQGLRTQSEPLLWVLHIGYFCVPLGALVEGFSILKPDLLALGSAQHIWMAGGFALMTLAVMVRATLGHTGQDLHADLGGTLIFGSVIGAALMRLAAGVWIDAAMVFYTLSAILWICAYLGFYVCYGRCLLGLQRGPTK